MTKMFSDLGASWEFPIIVPVATQCVELEGIDSLIVCESSDSISGLIRTLVRSGGVWSDRGSNWQITGLADIQDAKMGRFENMDVLVTAQTSDGIKSYIRQGGMWTDLGSNWAIDSLTVGSPAGVSYASNINGIQDVLLISESSLGNIRSFIRSGSTWSDLGANWTISGFNLPKRADYYTIGGQDTLVVAVSGGNKVKAYVQNGTWSDLGSDWEISTSEPVDTSFCRIGDQEVLTVTQLNAGVTSYVRSGGVWSDLGSDWQISFTGYDANFCFFDDKFVKIVTDLTSNKIKAYEINFNGHPISVSAIYNLTTCTCSSDMAMILYSDTGTYACEGTLFLDDSLGQLSPYTTIFSNLIPAIEKNAGIQKISKILLHKNNSSNASYKLINTAEEKALITSDYQLICCNNKLFLGISGNVASDITHIPGTNSDLICFVLKPSDLAGCSDCQASISLIVCGSDAANYKNLSKILILKD